jgi:hypothetical protein
VAQPGRARVYLPLTPSSLRDARESGGFGPAPIPGHAVTPALLDALGEVDEEDAEYVAMTAAALESLRMLDGDDPPARVVAAVDVAAWEPRQDARPDEPTAVAVTFTVPLKRLAAVHVDGPDARADVVAAREQLDAPENAPDDLPDAVERCLDHDLGWYAAQELDDLLDHLALGSPGGRATIA